MNTQGPLNFLMSLGAMLVSLVTLYLSYFDERYTLTGAMGDVEMTIQRSGGSDGAERTATFQYYPSPELILSHRGARPLILTDVDLFRSTSREACAAPPRAEFAPKFFDFETVILEPGEVRTVALEFALTEIDVVDSGGGFALEPRSELWCMQFTIVDNKGERREALMPAFDLETTFTPPTPDDELPDTDTALDVPRGPVTLVTRGWFGM